VFALARSAEALDDWWRDPRISAATPTHSRATHRLGVGGAHRQDILGRFGHVDTWSTTPVGRSAGRFPRPPTGCNNYERVMAVNYFGSVRMVLALLPHCGSAGSVTWERVQRGVRRSARSTRLHPSKAALDAFADVVGTETLRTTSRSPASTAVVKRR